MTVYSLPPLGVTAVETKVISGYCSTSKKSAERRWPSRCSTPVLSEAAAIVNEPVAAVGFSGSSCRLPDTVPNLPRTVVTIMCLAAKITSVWVVSRFQVVVAMVCACLPAVRLQFAVAM